MFGYFVRITEDRRKAEVYVPTLDDVIFPPRKAVLPLKDDAPCRALEASFNRKEANQVGNSDLIYWIRETWPTYQFFSELSYYSLPVKGFMRDEAPFTDP